MPRLLKQLLYGLLFLAVLIGIPVGIYFALLKPAPTCTDGIRNGDEQGIDCGGNCPRACIPKDIRPLESQNSVKIIPVGKDANGWFHESFLIEVANPNIEYAARSFHYEVAMQVTSSSTTLRKMSGDSYIYGGEVKTLVFPNIIVGEKEVQSVSVGFSNPDWIPASSWRRPALRVQNVVTRRDTSGGGNIIAEGEFVNDEVVGFPSVEIVAIFKGKYGDIAGVSRTEVANAMPGVVRGFAVVHPDISDADLSSTRVIVSAARQ